MLRITVAPALSAGFIIMSLLLRFTKIAALKSTIMYYSVGDFLSKLFNICIQIWFS